MEEIHSIYMIGTVAVCPVCSGMLTISNRKQNLKCVDCGKKFHIVDLGQTEREFICRRSA